jgi:hypothetical protein
MMGFRQAQERRSCERKSESGKRERRVRGEEDKAML